MRKGIILVLAVLAMVLPLFAGGTGESVDDGVTMIGISKLMSHPALDAAEQGCIEYLESTGLPVEFQLQNANGDVSTAASIAQQFRTLYHLAKRRRPSRTSSTTSRSSSQRSPTRSMQVSYLPWRAPPTSTCAVSAT